MDLRDAYNAIGILDHKVCDEDVVTAYYLHTTHSLSEHEGDSERALKAIAEFRNSRFLRFVNAIRQHLTSENVGLLSSPDMQRSSSPMSSVKAESASESLTPRNEDQDVINLEEEDNGSAEVSSDRSMSSVSDVDARTLTPCSTDSASSAGGGVGYDQVSNDDYSADSDFSDEVDEGRYFDASNDVWRCETCDELLVDERCPAGHAALVRCQTCDWKVEEGICPKCQPRCDDCGTEMLGAQCGYCQQHEDDNNDEDTIAFDTRDEIWRCIHCCWEIEPQKGGDGSCYCLNQEGEKHRIDLSECPDYEPADADNCDSDSDEESEDEEPTSEDERFIDDSDNCGHSSMEIEEQVDEFLVDA